MQFWQTTAYNLAIREWEWVDSNPVARITRERFNNQVNRWLSTDEEKRLLNASPYWLRDIVVFALNTGMRQAEILDLEWRCVDLTRQVVTIAQSKNGERRSLPANHQALEVLKSKARVRESGRNKD
jgi:integrase